MERSLHVVGSESLRVVCPPKSTIASEVEGGGEVLWQFELKLESIVPNLQDAWKLVQSRLEVHHLSVSIVRDVVVNSLVLGLTFAVCAIGYLLRVSCVEVGVLSPLNGEVYRFGGNRHECLQEDHTSD